MQVPPTHNTWAHSRCSASLIRAEEGTGTHSKPEDFLVSDTEGGDGKPSQEVKCKYGLRVADWSGMFLRLIIRVNSEAEPREATELKFK